MDRYFVVGLGLIGASFLMLLIALPRRGEVVGFLHHRDGAQAFYVMALLMAFVLGLVITLSHTG